MIVCPCVNMSQRWHETKVTAVFTHQHFLTFSFLSLFFFFLKRKDNGWHWPQSQDADQIGLDQASRCAVSELWEKSKVTHHTHSLTHTLTLSCGQEEHLFLPRDWFLQCKGDSLVHTEHDTPSGDRKNAKSQWHEVILEWHWEHFWFARLLMMFLWKEKKAQHYSKSSCTTHA